MLGTINVLVRGVAPLISNNPEAINNLPTGKKVDHHSAEYKELSFNCSLYKKGKCIYQPAEHFERCMEVAGGQENFKGRMSYQKIIKGGVVVEPNQIPHPKKNKPERFNKWVVINKARVMKTRAIFDKWELEFQIRVLNEAINFDTLKSILVYGGCYVGIGDWRPKYGRFEVIKFDVAKGGKRK